MEIVAKGIKKGRTITITAKNIDKRWIIDCDEKQFLPDLQREIRKRHPIGGTFYPEEGTGLYILSALWGTWFFDNTNTEIETEDFDEEIPVEEDGVY